MSGGEIGMRHIVDVDGQLLAIDAETIAPADLLSRAGRSSDRRLCLVRAGERFALKPKQLVHLSEDEVLFFESSLPGSGLDRLAA